MFLGKYTWRDRAGEIVFLPLVPFLWAFEKAYIGISWIAERTFP